MEFKDIDIPQLILDTKELLSSDKSITPSLKAIINLLLIVVSLQFSKVKKNSNNSSIPPSQDPNRAKNKKSNKKKKSGGQIGHKGVTLQKVSNPDVVIALPIDRRALPKNNTYTTSTPEIRQVKDIEVNVIITEYQAEVLIDEQGSRHVAKFPEQVTKSIQYGSGVKTNAVYMSYYQMSSLSRIQDNFSDQLNINLSDGSITNFSEELYNKLESFEEWAKANLLVSKVLHADETGLNVNGDRLWLHTLCDKKITLFHAHERRGKEAMDDMGVLPLFKGYLCHDHWKPYFIYFCLHLLCNAHHLRELVYIEETTEERWAKKLREFLLEINALVKEKGGALDLKQQKVVIQRYRKIIDKGNSECPQPEKIRGKRGPPKRTKSRNLLDRFRNYESEVLGFMTDVDLPFTNNQGENDLRMVKVKLKVSGCFRSMLGAQIYARVRSFINTCKKTKSMYRMLSRQLLIIIFKML